MSFGPQTITRGNVGTTILLAVNLTPVPVAGNSTVEQTFNVPGLLSSDQISNMSLQTAFTVNVDAVNWRCAIPGILTVAYQNPTGGSITPPAGLYYIEVNRLENLNLPAPAIFPT